MTNDFKKHMEEIERRKKESRIYTSHQLTGLEVAEMLGDKKHKSLYMKLAKEYDNRTLLSLAKDAAGRTNIENKGAYFMRAFYNKKLKKRN